MRLPNIILCVLVFCQESTSSDITQIGWVKIGGGPTIIFLLLSAPRFCHRWGHNYRHWWNHGGGAHVRESGLFVQLGSDITPPPLESGVRDEIRHQGEQLHVVQVHALQFRCAITEEKGIGVASSTVARGRNLIPAHQARLSQPTSRLSWGVMQGP